MISVLGSGRQPSLKRVDRLEDFDPDGAEGLHPLIFAAVMSQGTERPSGAATGI